MQSLTYHTRTQILNSLVSVSVIIMVLFSCNKTTSPVFGTYKIYSEDPSVNRWMAGENTYLKISNDNTIVYNSTINGKQKFHFDGNFALDEKTNELTIQWKQGKLPNKLQVQQLGSDYIIQIGTTTYKKEKVKS